MSKRAYVALLAAVAVAVPAIGGAASPAANARSEVRVGDGAAAKRHVPAASLPARRGGSNPAWVTRGYVW